MLTLRRAFLLWLPLAAMWILMSIEGPVVQAAAARAPETKLNLAAYGYAFFSLLILEAPVFMFLSASNALVKGPQSYERFRNYSYLISFCLSAACLLVAVSGAFYSISHSFVGLEEPLARLAEKCLLVLAVCPLMVGYRRFHQGILVKAQQSSWIAWGGFFRIAVAGVTAFSLLAYSTIPGGVIVCSSLSIAITVEAYFIRWRSQRVISELYNNPRAGDHHLSLAEMNRFYLPLAVASVVNIGVQPVLTFFLAQGVDAKFALASWPVLMSFQFLFFTPALAYQDIIIAHKHEDEGNGRVLKTLGFVLVALFAAGGALFMFTPAFQLWFVELVSISQELANYMYSPALFCIPMSGLAVWLASLRAHHTLEHTTRQIFIGSSVELLGSFLFMWALYGGERFSSIFAAVLSFFCARTLSCLYMWTVRLPPTKIRPA